MNNYDKAFNMIVQNNGLSVVMTIADSSIIRPSLQFDSNSPRYILDNVHIHWGKSNLFGSEHSVDNEFAAAEIHFAHYNQRYGSFSQALTQPDGLVVIAVLMSISSTPNPNLNWLIAAVQLITEYNSAATIASHSDFYLADLLPNDRSSVFRYLGSLTTPPCYESVTWLVFEKPIPINTAQLEQFRLLRQKSINGIPGHPLLGNRRYIQPINGRTVQTSDPSYH
ncbi:carbonic anhydrase 15-like [Oppia nitens]|uniref:carbonic anhydrase 15-like n=1 Tax=Oppia nitens TaxID=1686743 RepID=UPI0023DC2934|nr:carbonic anhydrase 15-like [Oppia nitens]